MGHRLITNISYFTHITLYKVPQGSVLRPLLFIMSMNDIGNVSDFLYTILYADDTSVLLNGKDYITLVKLFTLELDKLSV